LRTFLSGMAVLALSSASIAAATAQTTPNSSGTAPVKTMSPKMHGSMSAGMGTMMPACKPSSNYVVWYVKSTKTYYTRGNAMFGRGSGKYVCRSAAIAVHLIKARSRPHQEPGSRAAAERDRPTSHSYCPEESGMGLGLVSSTIAATQGVPKSQSGLASGLLNMSRLFGGALGLAILSTLAASETHSSLGVGSAQALTNGFGVAFRVGALFCVAGALLAIFQLRDAPKPEIAAARQHDELEESEPVAA